MDKTYSIDVKYNNTPINDVNSFFNTFYKKLNNKNDIFEKKIVIIDKKNNLLDNIYVNNTTCTNQHNLDIIIEETENDIHSNNCFFSKSIDSINLIESNKIGHNQLLNKSETEISKHKYSVIKKHFLTTINDNFINIDFEGILELIGGFNRWQILIFLTLLLYKIPHAMLNLSLIYMMYQPDHWCKINNFTTENNNDNNIFHTNEIWNWNTIFDSGLLYPYIDNEYYRKSYKQDQYSNTILNYLINSNNMKKCESWEYDNKIMKETIVTKFNIICDNNWTRAHVFFSYSMGYLIGCFIGGYISDRYGRRLTLLVFTFLATFFSFLLPNTVDLGSFLVILILLAICNEAANLASYILFMEITGNKYRSIVGCIQQIPWAIGYIFLTILAYITRSWLMIHYITTILLAISILFFYFIPESPRWLMVIGKVNKAEFIIRKASQINKKSLPSDLELITHTERSRWIKKNEEKNMLNLLFFSNISWKNGIVFFIWISASLIYYGLVIVISDQSRAEKAIFSENLFLNNGLAGFIELPTLLFCIYLMKFGRRKSQMIMFIGTGIFLILSMIFIFYQKHKTSFIFILLSKMCIQGAFNILYIFTSELYPTIVRNSVVGVSSMIGRCGSALSGYIAVSFNTISPFLPMSIFVFLSLIAGIIIILLPETKNIPLPETIFDAVIFQKSKNTEKRINDT
ncbi:Solute carrier family 22 member 13 [Strongyloides ratti]|uniref:Solute carrier family 22 member 13 n=1 Tax=Strongyloides ratti TaxID=34506 RepID=A0A090LMF0_STRRB|nr:Solute carrier family 22 member 13 [Strongyloides ratti]CEF70921.1 Solute carrier family 22 member 13 [Strongyloides ratti]